MNESVDRFERVSGWQSQLRDTSQQARADETVKLLVSELAPRDSVLEVGCGGGIILSRLREHSAMVVGTDLAYAPLTLIDRPLVQSRVEHLPFRDDAFDHTIAAEVIEHVRRPVRERAIEEICRVTKSSVVITVPLGETLNAHDCMCGSCGHVFQAWGHVARFMNAGQIRSLFKSDWRLDRVITIGSPRPRMLESLVSVAQRLGHYFVPGEADNVVCPMCGNAEDFTSSKSLLSRALVAGPSKVLPPHSGRWLGVRLQRK